MQSEQVEVSSHVGFHYKLLIDRSTVGSVANIAFSYSFQHRLTWVRLYRQLQAYEKKIMFTFDHFVDCGYFFQLHP